MEPKKLEKYYYLALLIRKVEQAIEKLFTTLIKSLKVSLKIYPINTYMDGINI